MKPKTKTNIVVILYLISIISFVVMIFGLFIWLTIWGVIAAVVGGVSFSIALVLGLPNDEGEGIFARGRDLG